MPKRFIRFNLPAEEQKKSLFLKDPQTDFLVILQKKVFALHKNLLSSSQFFRQLIDRNKKSVIISTHLNTDCFEKILGCFYGIEAALERHNIVPHILEILQLLRVKELNEQLKADMRSNFEEYGLFNEFYLSRMFGLTDIEDKCIYQLINQDFQQINYNKYDLFQLSPELFTFVLKEHQKLKANQQITGLGPNQIKAVCQQYSKITNSTINVQQIFAYGKKFEQQFEIESEEDPPLITRKRNATWNSTPQKEDPGKKVKIQNESMQSQPRIYPLDEKSKEAMKIKLTNSNTNERTKKHGEEIKSARNTTDAKQQQQEKDTPNSIEDLTKKLKQFEQKSISAHKKMENLKTRMLQYNQEKSKYDSQKKIKIDNSIQLKARTSSVQNSISKTLPEIAVLQKNEEISSDSDY